MLAPFLPTYPFVGTSPEAWSLKKKPPLRRRGHVLPEGVEGGRGRGALNPTQNLPSSLTPILLASANDVHFPLCTSLPN